MHTPLRINTNAKALYENGFLRVFNPLYPWVLACSLFIRIMANGNCARYFSKRKCRVIDANSSINDTALSSVLILFVARNRIKKPLDYLGLPLGLFILAIIASYIGTSCFVYYFPGAETQYITSYKIAYSSRNSCSGVFVYNHELNDEIRVCYPSGDVETNHRVFIMKKSNRYGIVVKAAATF